VLLSTLFLSNTFAEADWANEIRAVLPPNIILTDIREESDHLYIAGEAKENSDISNLMRAITQADLGSPELEVIRIKDGKRTFVLRVKVNRGQSI
jgi:Tfp pilus assembly protein PilN